MASTPATEPHFPEAPADPRGRWEIPLAACLSALFFAAFLAVPYIGALGLPFVPVPAVRATHRRGLASGLLVTGLASALLLGLGLVTGSLRGEVGVAGSAALAIGLPTLFAARVGRGRDASRSYLLLCAVGCTLWTAVLAALPAAGQPAVGAELRAAFDANIPAALESYRRGKVDAATLEQVRATLLAARDFAIRYWPGLLGACWVFQSSVAFYLGARWARPAPSAEAVRFETLSVPAGVAGLFVAAGAGFALLDGVFRTVAGDLLLALAALYFVAGLSIICHFARRWFRARLLRFGLYVLVAYFPMSLGVALLGLFDWYLRFRRRGEKE